jgi:hypothetical protein
MNHEHVHAHHVHAHGHDHAHAHPAAAEGASVLMRGALSRVAVTVGAIALLWVAVAWALMDLAT